MLPITPQGYMVGEVGLEPTSLPPWEQIYSLPRSPITHTHPNKLHFTLPSY